MGCWGAGLYQDDDALDLKGSIAVLAKLPVDGNRLLDILLSNRSEPPDFHRDGGPAFWLVVADQFERRGIACAKVFKRALAAIDKGEDLRDLRDRDMSEKDLKKRAAVLAELRQRLRSPRPLRPRRKPSKPPPFPVRTGDVFAFPTMREPERLGVRHRRGGEGINPYSTKRTVALYGGDFQADGWGALIILMSGRAYDWFPWCAFACLSVSPKTEPTLETAKRARLLIDDSASLAVPRGPHLKRMRARLLGTLQLDPRKVKARVNMRPDGHKPEFAVYAGWSLHGISRAGRFDGGVAVADLLADR